MQPPYSWNRGKRGGSEAKRDLFKSALIGSDGFRRKRESSEEKSSRRGDVFRWPSSKVEASSKVGPSNKVENDLSSKKSKNHQSLIARAL